MYYIKCASCGEGPGHTKDCKYIRETTQLINKAKIEYLRIKEAKRLWWKEFSAMWGRIGFHYSNRRQNEG